MFNSYFEILSQQNAEVIPFAKNPKCTGADIHASTFKGEMKAFWIS